MIVTIDCIHCGTKLSLDLSTITLEAFAVNCPKCKKGTNNKLADLKEKAQQQARNSAMMQGGENNDKTQVSEGATTMCCGWLIVHDEQTSKQTFELKYGKNVIGRKSVTKPCDIMIDTNDMAMSRQHCIIEARRTPRAMQYIITDIGSLNGIFINANLMQPLKKNMEGLLKDGDTIQLGHTKVVIKLPQENRNSQSASREVDGDDYAPTIIS